MGLVLGDATILPAAYRTCLRDAAQHSCESDASLGVMLRIDEDFAVHDPVSSGFLQVRDCELVEVLHASMTLWNTY